MNSSNSVQDLVFALPNALANKNTVVFTLLLNKIFVSFKNNQHTVFGLTFPNQIEGLPRAICCLFNPSPIHSLTIDVLKYFVD